MFQTLYPYDNAYYQMHRDFRIGYLDSPVTLEEDFWIYTAGWEL